MTKDVSPTNKRSLLVKACIKKQYSAEQILEILAQINEHPEEEREKEAERILSEMTKE